MAANPPNSQVPVAAPVAKEEQMDWPTAFVIVGVAWAAAYMFKDWSFSIKFKDPK